MYLPENNNQMFEILSTLRVYAAMNDFRGLAEELDDAILLLAVEGRNRSRRRDLEHVTDTL